MSSKILVTYFLFSFFFFSFFASGFVDSQDGFQYLAIARRMYYDKTFQMPLESFPDENVHMSTTESADGKIYSPTGLGYSLSLLPAVFLEDVFLKISGAKAITAFPLKSDWPVLLFASMTNAFWAAILVVFLFSYFLELNIKQKEAAYLSFFFTIGTNLFVYTKHTFAQMMFVSMMTAAFYFMKKYVNSNQKKYLLLCGLSFGLVVIAYNPTYLFILPALGLYYLFLTKFRLKIANIKNLIVDIIISSLGLLPFFLTYLWFNKIRFGGAIETGYGTSNIPIPSFPPAYVIIEGIWGLLFSPGKSIFLYSPILLILIIFWFKLKRKYLSEIVASLTVFTIYLWNIGTLLGGKDYLVWHGDSSWGPRYMLPVLPLLLLFIATIYTQLTKKQKKFVFFPLLLLGFYINFLSILLPYQVRFAGLQPDAFINGRNFNVYEYGNEIPRYMPAFKLSKTLFRRIKNIRQTYDHGKYNLRLIDGFDYPFDLGWSVWRGIKPLSYFEFKDPKDEINKLSIQIRNHQMDPTSKQYASFQILLNGIELANQDSTISADREKDFVFDVSKYDLSSQANLVEIKSSYESSSAAQLDEKQVLFLQIIRINDMPQNIQTIDYPYVSEVSKGLLKKEYRYWGSKEKNPWAIWHMHSGVYEQTFDLWWLRPLHYWDLPKDLYFVLFLLNIGGILYFGYYSVKSITKK